MHYAVTVVDEYVRHVGLTDNVVWLHQYLFNDSSYQVSSTVQEISDQVSAKSGY